MRSARRRMTHRSTRTAFESLESRAMLAGLGPDSFSGLGSNTAVLLPGVSGTNLFSDSLTSGPIGSSASPTSPSGLSGTQPTFLRSPQAVLSPGQSRLPLVPAEVPPWVVLRSRLGMARGLVRLVLVLEAIPIQTVPLSRCSPALSHALLGRTPSFPLPELPERRLQTMLTGRHLRRRRQPLQLSPAYLEVLQVAG